MFTVGQEVTIAAEMWVHSQSLDQMVLNRWTKLQVLRPVKAMIEGVGEDGWLLLLDKNSMIRYKVWPTALEKADV